MARKQLGTQPAGATDLATKGYVDTCWHPGYVTGRYYLPPGALTNQQGVPGASVTGTPNPKIWAFPARIPQRIKIDRLGAAVAASPDSSGSFLLAIYASDPTTKLPAALLAQTGTGSTASTGTVNVDLASAVWLDPGLYWFAFQTNSITATFMCISSGFPWLPWLIGIPGGGDALQITAVSTHTSGLTFSNTYGSWPSDLTGATVYRAQASGAQCPLVQFRVSDLG